MWIDLSDILFSETASCLLKLSLSNSCISIETFYEDVIILISYKITILLNISESAVRNSLFQRIKHLEDRILYLEGISPDYLQLSVCI